MLNICLSNKLFCSVYTCWFNIFALIWCITQPLPQSNFIRNLIEILETQSACFFRTPTRRLLARHLKINYFNNFIIECQFYFLNSIRTTSACCVTFFSILNVVEWKVCSSDAKHKRWMQSKNIKLISFPSFRLHF